MEVLGTPRRVLGTPWVDVWRGLGDDLSGVWRGLGGDSGSLGDTLDDLVGEPWKNLLEEPSGSTLTPKLPKTLRSTS